MNASDELRRLLDENGVEYATDDNATSNDTMWTTQNGGWMFDCDYMEPLNEKPGTIGAKTELMIYGYTPEQAIAATLGSDREKELVALVFEMRNDMYQTMCDMFADSGWGAPLGTAYDERIAALGIEVIDE